MTKRLLNIREAADRLCLKEKTVRNWIYERKIDSHKIGGSVRVSEETIEDIIAKGVQPRRKR